MFLKAPGTVGNREIQFVETPRCPGDGWTQSVQPSGIVETGGTQSPQSPRYFGHWRDSVIPSPMFLKAPGTVGNRETKFVDLPGFLRTAGLNRFSPQASSRLAELSHFRPPGHFSPQAPLGQASSVFSVAQVPWGLARLSNSRLPVPFGTSGTRLLYPPMYAVDRRGLSHLSPPGILGIRGTQSFQAPCSLRLQVPLEIARFSLLTPPGALGTACLLYTSPSPRD